MCLVNHCHFPCHTCIGLVETIHESLFGHINPVEFESVNFPNFVPFFNISLLEDTAMTYPECENSTACLYDTMVTSNLDIGLSALALEKELLIFDTLDPSEANSHTKAVYW